MAFLQAAAVDFMHALQLITIPRCYIIGFVHVEDRNRGEWAFRRGQPQPLGPRPNLVHFEELYERPGPHFT